MSFDDAPDAGESAVRGDQVARRRCASPAEHPPAQEGIRALCVLALTASGLAVLGALLAATYVHQGQSPFSLAGTIGQVPARGRSADVGDRGY